MVEKIGTIKNPLTIIAMFAAIAEISGTAVLPFISAENQGTYIWFLMIFPLLLIIVFFLTLNFNHKVLYAPSDFKDEENFFKSFKPASPVERDEKFREQAREVAEDATVPTAPEIQPPQMEPPPPSPTASSVPYFTMSDRVVSLQARYSLAEDLVLNKISRETGQGIRRDVSFGLPGTKERFVFDGVIIDNKNVTAVEIKYMQSLVSVKKRVSDVINRVSRIQQAHPQLHSSSFTLVVVLVTEKPESEHSVIASKATEAIGITPFPVHIRVFNLSQLEKEVEN
jgi:hypothetical protein